MCTRGSFRFHTSDATVSTTEGSHQVLLQHCGISLFDDQHRNAGVSPHLRWIRLGEALVVALVTSRHTDLHREQWEGGMNELEKRGEGSGWKGQFTGQAQHSNPRLQENTQPCRERTDLGELVVRASTSVIANDGA